MNKHDAHRNAVKALIEYHEQAVIELKEELRVIDKAQNTENQLQFELGEVTKK